MSLEILPIELLEIIARRLDGVSLAAFSQASVRFRDAISRLPISLRFVELNHDIQSLLHDFGPNVTSLNISNCSLTSGQLESLTRQVANTQTLTVVNTRLTMRAVLNAMQSLRRLTEINFSVPINDLNHRQFVANDRIVRMYVEVPPSDPHYAYAIELINSCEKLERLHFFVVDSVLRTSFNSLHTVARTQLGILAAERWSTLHTVILSSEGRSSSQRLMILVPRLFSGCATVPDTTQLVTGVAEFKTVIFERDRCNVVLTSRDIDKHPWESAVLPEIRRSFNLIIGSDGPPFNRRLPEPMWGAPQGLAVSFPPIKSPLPLDYLSRLLTPNLTELNLTKAHWSFPEDSWTRLVEAAPALEALAIAPCALPPLCDDDAGHWKLCEPNEPATHQVGGAIRRNARNRTARSASAGRQRVGPSVSTAVDDCRMIEALSRVPLKRLYISADDCVTCPLYERPVRRLGKISELRHLESLTLKKIPFTVQFLDNVWSPTVKTLKLISVGVKSNCDYLNGFRRFINRCTSLRNLKLEHDNLMLSSTLLWQGLGEASELRQLCLASSRREAIELATVGRFLAPIRSKLQHLHIHSLAQNYRQVEKFFKTFLAAGIPVDASDTTVKVDAMLQRSACCVTVTLPLSDMYDYGGDKFPIPGRSVCFSGNFIAYPKPVGWEFY